MKLRTEKGTAVYIKTDVFKQQMWYAYDGDKSQGSTLVPLGPDRVREIIKLNKDGKKPSDLMEYVVKEKVVVPEYANVDGQDSLDRFEHIFKKPKKRPNKNKSKQKAKAGNSDNNSPNPQKNTNPTNKAGENSPPKKRRNNKRKPKPNSNKNNPPSNDSK